jgi:subtilisin family serine protease
MIFSLVSLSTLAFLSTLNLSAAKVSVGVYRGMEAKKTAEILVSFGGTADALKAFSHGNADPTKVYQALVAHASSKQKNVLDWLTSDPAVAGSNYESFWISNSLYIEQATKEQVSKIEKFPEVFNISLLQKEDSIQVPAPINVQLDAINITERRRLKVLINDQEVEESIKRIGAPSLWAKRIEGAGIVVGSIDTGVRETHRILAGRWRKKKGWYDPSKKAATPYDDHGHGTHTIGTMVGLNGYGVAPRAQFIACKGCSNDNGEQICDPKALLSCAQFMMCPTDATGDNPDCSLKPHVINNSWGSTGRAHLFCDAIAAWRAVGIIPVFSVGNIDNKVHKLPACGTVLGPSDSPDVIAVGATGVSEKTGKDVIESTSARGPTLDGRIKPDISAPGLNIVSAHYKSDNMGSETSGTSMAAPHVTGAVALLLSFLPDLSYDQVYNFLTKSVDTSMLEPIERQHGFCLSKLRQRLGQKGNTGFVYPNNFYGWGRLNVSRAYKLASRSLDGKLFKVSVYDHSRSPSIDSSDDISDAQSGTTKKPSTVMKSMNKLKDSLKKSVKNTEK